MSFQHITWSIICLAGCLSGCTDKSKSPPAAEKPPAQASNTGTEEPEKTAEARIPVGINTLEGFDADVMHYSDQGSGFFPMSVVRALNDSKTGRPFLENLERFGLVPGQKSSRNPEGFPVGIVTNKIKSGEREIEMFGFTCAACHTSDLHYKGQVVRVEGGAGLFYVDQLGDAIADSLTATLKDPEETWAFLQRLTKESKVAGSLIQKFAKLKDLEADGELGRAVAEHLKTRLANFRKEITILRSEGVSRTAEAEADDLKTLAAELGEKSLGAGSPLKSLTDSDGRKKVIEQLLKEFEGNIDNIKYRLAFLKVRHWLSQPGHRLAAGYGRADDFGTARVELFAGWNEKNMLPVNAPVSTPPLWKVDKYEWLHWNANSNSVIQRSIGEGIGVGATYDAQTFATSVNIVNQMLIEQQLQKLAPPQWPAAVFGTPDEALVKKGAELYGKHCADCHTPEGVNEKGLLVVKLFTLDEMKTDPLDATNFDRPVYKPDGSTAGFAASIATLLDELQKQAKSGMSAEHQQLMDDLEQDRLPVIWRDTMRETGGPVYPGRLLEGVWATAPYLHNGSVPTLYHLLLPAAERPKTFQVGSQEFDPKAVGFVWEKELASSTPDKPLFEFDTTIEGNRNVGHEYGAELAPDEKWALVEYLKVHKDPQGFAISF
jgi:mono/diheme cytochrome c family protein